MRRYGRFGVIVGFLVAVISLGSMNAQAGCRFCYAVGAPPIGTSILPNDQIVITPPAPVIVIQIQAPGH
jgi:hypothetical protein